MTATQATPPLTAKQAIDWSKVVEAHRDWIKRLVVARTGAEDLADDVIQEVGMAVTRSNARPTCSDEIAPWLCKIAIRQCIIALRSVARTLEGFCRERNRTERADPIFWLLIGSSGKLFSASWPRWIRVAAIAGLEICKRDRLRGHRLEIGRFQAYGRVSRNESEKTTSSSAASPGSRWRRVAMNTPDENLILRFASGELSAEEEAGVIGGLRDRARLMAGSRPGRGRASPHGGSARRDGGHGADSPIFAETKIGKSRRL